MFLDQRHSGGHTAEEGGPEPLQWCPHSQVHPWCPLGMETRKEKFVHPITCVLVWLIQVTDSVTGTTVNCRSLRMDSCMMSMTISHIFEMIH